jgi:mitochondrial fission protein ELM1
MPTGKRPSSHPVSSSKPPPLHPGIVRDDPLNPLISRLLEKQDAEERVFDGWPGRCWVISDGTMGMVSQCLALLRALDIDGEDIRAVPTPLLRMFPALAAIPGWQLTMGRKPDWLKAGIWPDLLITCGKRMAGISIGVKRLSRGQTRTIHIQDPHIAPRYFDLLITPAHDHIAVAQRTGSQFHDNLLVTMGALNRLSPEEIAEASAELPAEVKKQKKPIIAVMLGGNNSRYKAGKEAFLRLADQLTALAKKTGGSLIILPSRRTPKRHLRGLSDQLGTTAHQIWDGKGDNPYPGVLGLADILAVTSDSVNMISEACITGKPVLTIHLAEETGRIATFHQMMEERGHILRLGDILSGKTALPKKMAILDERTKIASQIHAFFGVKPD